MKCCEYYNNIQNKSDEEIYEYAIGSQTFDKAMQNRLSQVLRFRQSQYGGEKGNVLEVMAGTGRNREVLNQYFNEIEMLE